MGAPATANQRRRFQSVSVNVDVDVDIDEEFLEENGYHHEDDCPGADEPAIDTDRQRLSDWHDHTHGLSLWANCVYEPCNLLTDEFRSTP